MKKNLYIALGIILGVSVLLNVIQLTTTFTKNKRITKLQTTVNHSEDQMVALVSTNDELEMSVTNLEMENTTLVDSLTYLNKVIRRLRSKANKYASRLKDMEAAMAFLKEKQVKLDEQIKFGSQRMADAISVETLQKEKRELEAKMSLLENKSDSLYNLKDMLYVQLAEKEGERLRYMKRDEISMETLNIIQNTKVEFFQVIPRKENSKEAKSVKKWYDTVINLALTLDDESLIQGEEFLVRIINTKTQEVISPRENNQQDTNGITFRFDGNPVSSIIYPNYQKKKDKEYSIQVLLLKNHEEYALNQGTTTIVF